MHPDNDIQRSKSRRSFLVGVVLRSRSRSGGASHSPEIVEEHLDELQQLALSAGSHVVGRAVQSRQAPDPATFIGKGKAAEIGAAAKELGADLLVFDDDLSSSQVKALEEATGLSVLDRSGLILEIFDQRAKSREARTQVELARLNYLLPRLTRRWSHLSRQGGGVGTRGGEGEKQLEQDRRLLRTRIRRLEQDLVSIERTRGVQRHGRGEMPVVALTGYTNAGKSTLFNRLTSGNTLAEDRLFATLDAKLRRGGLGVASAPAPIAASVGTSATDGEIAEGDEAGKLTAREAHDEGKAGDVKARDADDSGANGESTPVAPAVADASAAADASTAAGGAPAPEPGGSLTAVFADTVGFIRKLPHHLVSSFRSTLGEITAADIVLHVVDRSHPQWHDQMEVADAVLDDLGVERRRVITVFNKSDRLPPQAARFQSPPNPQDNDAAVWVSARTGSGLDALRAEIARRIPLLGKPAPAPPAGSRDSGSAAGGAGEFDTLDSQPLTSPASVGP